MKLSILIATQGRREHKFINLVKELDRQAGRAGGEVEIVALWNNGEYPIGTIRQKLLEDARGDYICFIDDDDKVPETYVKTLVNALGKDYVGFKVKLFNNGMEQKPAFHDLQYQVWTEDDKGFYRGVTHLNPLKRDIALKGSFDEGGAGEDERWCRQVVPYVKTQNYIDDFMYYYYHDSRDTSFGNTTHKNDIYKRPPLGYTHFRYHPDSKLISREE